MRSLLYSAVCVFVVFILSSFSSSFSLANEDESSAGRSSPTAYESHAGLFIKRSSFISEDPLIRDEGKVSRPLFKVVDRADDIVGRTFHTKTYKFGTQESFITTEDADGAKMGFDF